MQPDKNKTKINYSTTTFIKTCFTGTVFFGQEHALTTLRAKWCLLLASRVLTNGSHSEMLSASDNKRR